jgi:hypothetical protein
MTWRAKPNLNSLAEVKLALDQYAIAVQDRITRSALRQFAKDECARIKAARGGIYAASSKHLGFRIKFWPSGVVWLGVGDRIIPGFSSANSGSNRNIGGRAKRRIYDEEGLGWRTHFGELGWHTWPRGAPHNGVGRGWKKSLRHRGRGGYHRGTRASEIVHRTFGPNVLGYLIRELQFMDAKKTKGRKARRGAVPRLQEALAA